MYDLLIKNGKIVTAESVTEGNIAVKNGKIRAILIKGEEPEAKRLLMQKESMYFREQLTRTRI